jgi:hypothetical protein
MKCYKKVECPLFASPTDEDSLDVAYYLFPQDRVAEALFTFQNLEEVKVNVFQMDLEFLFSANPFFESGA